MKKLNRLSAGLLIYLSLSVLIFTSCDNIGIFATIAVSGRVDKGLLPEGTDPSKAFHIGTHSNGSNYDFFSSGGSLWVRNSDNRDSVTSSNKWSQVSLGGWENIQSIDATNTRIYMTVIRTQPNPHEVALMWFEIDDYSPAAGSITFHPVSNTNWRDTGSSFTNAYVFCPNPANTEEVFVNVLSTNASYGNSFDYVASDLYRADNPSDWSIDAGASLGNLTTPLRYIESAAYGGTNYRFSAIQNAGLQTDNGILLDESGATIADNLDRPVTGLTWLPNIGTGMFIAGGTSTSDSGAYSIYASSDGVTWDVVPGSSASYQVQSFIDISTTTAGANADILAGRVLSNNTGGYLEIDAPDGTVANWTITLGKNGDFANQSSYPNSNLSKSAITNFAIHDGYLYASASNGGLWHANTGVLQPEWSRE